MRHLRFLPLVLLLVVAGPLHAQAGPYMAEFEFVSSNGYDQYFGKFATGGVFQVFCVDPQHFVAEGDAFGVWVTRMDATDKDYLRNASGGAWSSYLDAARMATYLVNPSGLSTADVNNLQLAIWWAMGYRDPTYQYTLGTSALNYASWQAQAAGIVVSPDRWIVISSKSGDKQEFISLLPDRPQETVPEPATMVLLATGLASLGVARKRRNGTNQ